MANLNIVKYKKFLMLTVVKLFARYPVLQKPETIEKVQIKAEVYSKVIIKYNYKFFLAIANNIIKFSKNDADGYSLRADCYYGLENYELALTDYNKAIELNPDDAEAYLGRANCYEKQENHELALADYNKAIVLNPDFTAAFISLASYYEKQENHEFTLATFNKAIESNLDLPDAYLARANYLRNRSEHELALADFIKATELGEMGVFNIATDYLKQGKEEIYSNDNNELESALTYLIKSCELNAHKQNDYKIALEIFSKYIELIPDFAFAYVMRAFCYLEQRNHELALADCNKAIELIPNLSLAYQTKALCYFGQKKYELALVNLDKTIKLNPKSDDNIYALKDDCQYWIYRNSFDLQIKQKNYDLVLADYVKAIKLKNGDYFRRLLSFELGVIHSSENFRKKDIKSQMKELSKCDLSKHDLSKYGLSEDEVNSLQNSVLRIESQMKELLNDLSKTDLSEDEVNSLDNSILINIDKAIKSSVSTEDKKEYCFLASDIACREKEFDKAEDYIKLAFENFDSTEQSHKDIYLQDIRKAKEIDKKNTELEEKNKQLELEIQQKEAALEEEKVSLKKLHEKEQEMISFFTHTLRNALASAPESLRQAIRLLGSEDYEKNKKYYKAINKITALFSTLSLTDCLIDTFKQSINDPEEFKLAWQKDNTGDATPKWVIASALRQSLNRIIFMSDASQLEKLLNVTETSAIVSTRKSFIETVLPLNIDNQGINTFYDWLNGINTIEISIEETNHSNFGINQVKFSLLFAITSEILLNALKYWNGTGHIQINWQLIEENYIFTVKNPCHANASSNLAGTHKGIAFINRLMELLGDQAQFNCLPEEQLFTAQLKLHKSLLGDNT